MRLAATMAVILIHTTPISFPELGNQNKLSAPLLINQISRFAVPLFFVASGFFWGKKIINENNIFETWKKSTYRLGIIFISWSIVYATPYIKIFSTAPQNYNSLIFIKQTYWNLSNFATHPFYFILEGSKSHLWFLPSLIICLSIASALVYKDKTRTLYIISLLLYTIGTLGKSYSNTPYGIDLDINTRNGPFFGLIFFTSGYYFSKIRPSRKLPVYGLAILLAGFITQAKELFFLNSNYGTSLIQDYCFSTYLMGIGASIIGIFYAPYHALRSASLDFLSKITFGIYLVHFIFIDIFIEISKIKPDFSELSNPYVLPILVFITSAIFTIAIKKTRPLNWLVR